MTVELITDGAEMAALLRSPGGAVMRHLTDRATAVQLAARAQISRDLKGSGRLAAGITKRPGMDGSSPKVMVGAWNIPYAVYVHEGTMPHIIRPVNKAALAFNWPGHGETTTVKVGRASKKHPGGKTRDVNTVLAVVHHPGTRPVPYLADNLHLAVE